MATLLSASAFHFSTNVRKQLFEARAIYAKAIRRLRQRQDLGAHAAIGRQAVLLAFLVTLTITAVDAPAD